MYVLTRIFHDGDPYEPYIETAKDRYFVERDNAVKALLEDLPELIKHFVWEREDINHFQKAVEKHQKESGYTFKFVGMYVRIINNENEMSVLVHQDSDFKDKANMERAYVKVELIVPEDKEREV